MTRSPPRPPPTPPGGAEKRVHRRFELFAQAEVGAGGDLHVLRVSNISMGGLFLEGDPRELRDLKLGGRLELGVFASGEEEAEPLVLEGVIRRLEHRSTVAAGGFGVEFERLSLPVRARLDALLTRLARYK